MKRFKKEFDNFVKQLNELGDLEDSIKDHVSARLKKGFESIINRLDGCESPIEQMMSLELDRILTSSKLNAQADSLSITKQYECAFKSETEDHKFVRIDFFITYIDESKGIEEHFAVECDGHDYHERTKEQAARDRRKDRNLARNGITVIRFTGSEIYRDPIGCAVEVEKIIKGNVDKAYKIRDNIHLPF